jgi:O-antigen/teichoic acid export membrane protein
VFGLISAFSILGTYQVVSAILSAVRTKLIAILLGPNGLGIFSQAKSFQSTVSFLVTLGIQAGVVNLIAEANAQEDRARQRRIVITVSLLYAFLGCMVLILGWLFSQPLSEWIFGSGNYRNLIVIVCVSVFFLAQYNLMLAIFRGLLQWKLYATVAIFSYAVAIVVSIVLIVAFGLVGAVFSLVITQVAGLIFGLVFTKVRVGEALRGGIRLDWAVVKKLVGYVGPLLGGDLVLLFTDLYVRGVVILRLGADQGGFYQVLTAVSNLYFWAIIHPVTTYSMPKAATLVADKKAIAVVQNDGIRLSLLGIFPILTLVYGLREVWIPFFFSGEFLVVGSLLMWWLIGDIFRVLRVVMGVDLIPLGRLRFRFLQSLSYCGCLALVTVPFLGTLGLKAAAVAYLISNILVFILSFFYHLRTTAFSLSGDNLFLLVKASGMLAVAFWFSHNYPLDAVRLGVMALALVGMVFGLVKPGERRKAIAFAREKAWAVLRLGGNEKKN